MLKIDNLKKHKGLFVNTCNGLLLGTMLAILVDLFYLDFAYFNILFYILVTLSCLAFFLKLDFLRKNLTISNSLFLGVMTAIIIFITTNIPLNLFIRIYELFGTPVDIKKLYILLGSLILMTISVNWQSIKDNEGVSAERNELKIQKLELISCVAIFFLIKLLIINLISGNFIDEYLHIFSAHDLITHGDYAYFYREDDPFGRYGPYDKGGLLILTMAVMFKVFGFSLMSAKVAGAIIATACFTVLAYLGGKLLNNRFSFYSYLALVAVTPQIIFNHLYARVYLVYEVYLLLNILLIYLFHTKRYRYATIAGSFMAINTILFFDPKLLPCYLPFFVYIFFRLPFFTDLQKKILFAYFILVGVIINLTGVLAPLGIVEAENILGFNQYFFSLNLGIIIIFIFSYFYINIKYKTHDVIFLIASFTVSVLVFHLSLDLSIQYLRTIFYFFGIIMLIISFLIFDILKKNIKFFIYSNIIFVTTTIANFYYLFLPYPHIPNEVDYVEYMNASMKAREICHDAIFISSINNTFIPELFGVKVDLTTYIRETLLANDGRYYKKDGKFFTVYGDTPVITDSDEVDRLIYGNKNLCLLVGHYFKDSSRFISKDTHSKLENIMSYYHFEGNLPLRLYFRINK